MWNRVFSDWLLALIGVIFVALFIVYVFYVAESFIIDVLERALPFIVGVVLIWDNYWLLNQQEVTPRIRRITLASLITAILFAGIVWWLLFLVRLEATVPDELDYIYLNATAIGALTGSAIGYQYSRLQHEQTRLDALTQELQTANTQLRSKVERLDEFASIVSHDLRNPLNVASGYLAVARENPSPETFEKIEIALTRADDIITDMLALARYGQTVTDPTPVDLDQVTKRAYQPWKPTMSSSRSPRMGYYWEIRIASSSSWRIYSGTPSNTAALPSPPYGSGLSTQPTHSTTPNRSNTAIMPHSLQTSISD